MIEYFAQSHVGLVRKGNEDSYYAPSQSRPKDPQFFLCVADGLGGHNAGEIASQLAVRTMVTSMQTMEGKNQMLDHPFETMQRLFFEANDKIHMLSTESEKMYGMGTTLTAAVCKKHMVCIAHVGDSRAYLFNEDGLVQITTDHTFVQTLIQSGQLTEKAALTHPYRHVITRAVGIEQFLDVDFFEADWKLGDTLLLCSDGLTNMVSNEQIQQIIKTEKNLQKAAELLVETANRNGGRDNITVLLISRKSNEVK